MENISEQELQALDAVMEDFHREIPENSPTLLVSENTSRFSGATWFEKIQNTSVIVAGIGGIGSWVTLLLSRVNVKNIYIYDMDRVEAVNMAGQFYSHKDIGRFKVEAVRNSVIDFSRYYSINAQSSPYDNHSLTGDIMICGFDNMEARKVFFNRWLEHVNNYYALSDRKNCLFIDGRLNAEDFQILAIQGDDNEAIKKYQEEWLFDDSEVEEAVCSYKQTSFMSCMIASFIVNIFVNFVANQCSPIFPRDVPFFTTYSADTMFIKMNI